MTSLLNVNTIEIPKDRQRAESADKHIKELADSILANGLINPITVTKDRQLVAGFCRLSAVRSLAASGKTFLYDGQQVPPNQIPVLLASSEEPRVLFRIELEENLRRKNLSPAEQARAVARLHAFFAEQNISWTQEQTAQKLVEHEVVEEESTAKKDVSRALLIAAHADDEDVKKAKTENEAYKLAKKKSEQLFARALGDLLEEEEQEYNILFEGSYTDFELPLETYDCIIVDPPYGIEAHTFGEQTKALSHTYKDDQLAAIEAKNFLLSEKLLASCKSKMHLFFFHDIRFFSLLRLQFEAGGYYVWPTPIIWAKGTGHMPQPDYGPQRSYEAIIFASRGRKPVIRHGSDVIFCRAEPDKIHSAQKPVALYEELLSWSVGPGDHVLDFCCGSGTIFAATKGKNIYTTGIEIDKEMCKIARTRM